MKQLKNQFAKGYVEILKSEENETEGKLGLCIISTETVDRQGDQIMVEGWDFKAFKKNPLLLWSHNSGMGENRPAIGRVEDVKIDGGKVLFTPVFDLKDDFAKMIFDKFKNKFLNAFSIGFRPLEYTETDMGYKFLKQEALEFSAVNVPANAEALVVLRGEGIDVCKDFAEWKKDAPLADDMEEDEEDVEDEKEHWKTMGDLQIAMFELLFKDINEDKFNEIAKGYAKFNRIAPQLKHFKRALLKVALGKRCGGKKPKKELSEVVLMMQLLKGVAQKLEVKA
jgi:hypothetical protein